MHTGLSGLVQAFRSRVEQEQEFVLATIVETAGSTYRKAGARMLISRNGELHGLLSGGCLEADLYEHAKRVFEERRDHTVFYDMRSDEDLIWGLGLGCDGAVRIRLEYLDREQGYQPLELIRAALEGGSPAALITVLESGLDGLPAGRHFLHAPAATAADLPPALQEAAEASLANGQSHMQTVSVEEQPVTVFLGLVLPPVRLLIIGGGPDAVPVTEAARLLGWDVTVTDYRQAFCRAERFPAADRVIHSPPETLPEHVDTAAQTAVVLMTHKLEYDRRYLQRLVQAAPAYLGLLGPAARRQELLKDLDAAARQSLEGRVFGPVGLDIGAQLPEEIAFSLVAEIQAISRQRRGGFLSQAPAAAPQEQAAAATAPGALYAIVLAAGRSTRFGALKQLLEFNAGSLLRNTTRLATSALDNRVIVVHGPKPTKCQRETTGLEIQNVINEDYESGIATSLLRGLDQVPDDCRGVLILLCDQPLVGEEQITRLMTAWQAQPDAIVAAEYAGSYGVPAIIPRRLFPELRKLYGDIGAKSVLTAHADEIVPVAMPEAEFDIDTQADYESVLYRKLAAGQDA